MDLIYKTVVVTSNTSSANTKVIGFHTAVIEEFHAWMACSITCMLISIYILVMLTCFLKKKKFFSSIRGADISAINRNNRRNETVLNAIVFAIAFTYTIYLAIDVPLFWKEVDPYCKHYNVVKVVCAAIILFLVYFALWYRVYVAFYINPMVCDTIRRSAKVLNKLAPFLLIIMAVVNAVDFLMSPLYDTKPFGCLKTQISVERSVEKWLLLVITTLSFQVLMLFSLIYPLNLHRKKMLFRGIENKSTVPFIKRAAFTAIVAITSDIINAIYALVNKHQYIYLSNIVYDTNMFLNVIALIFSFVDWREKLIPCFVTKNRQHANSAAQQEIELSIVSRDRTSGNGNPRLIV